MIKRDANIHVAYADGHQIVRKDIVNLINSFDHIVVDSDVDDGKELIDKIGSMNKPPDICIVDLNMPVSNGFQTIHEVNKRWPKMKKIGLSIDDDHFSLIANVNYNYTVYVPLRNSPTQYENIVFGTNSVTASPFASMTDVKLNCLLLRVNIEDNSVPPSVTTDITINISIHDSLEEIHCCPTKIGFRDLSIIKPL